MMSCDLQLERFSDYGIMVAVSIVCSEDDHDPWAMPKIIRSPE